MVRFGTYSQAAQMLNHVFPERRCTVRFDPTDEGVTIAIHEIAGGDPNRIVRAWLVQLEPRFGMTRPQLFCQWAEAEVSERDTVLREMLYAHAAQGTSLVN